MSHGALKRTEITHRREWDGGVPGEEVTVEVPETDRLRVLIGGAEITLQDDNVTGRVEVIVTNGNITLWT